MSMEVQYIGEDTVWHNLLPEIDIELKKDSYYNVEVSIDGPQMFVNGQQIITPESTVIISFADNVWIPYAPDLVSNFWRLPLE